MSTDTIDESNGRYANSDISNLPAKDVVKKKRSLTICTECKQEIGPGLQHSCSIAQSSVNIVDHVLTLPDKQQEQVITSLLKTKAQNLEAETSGYQNVSLTLSTKGAKARVTLNPKTVETTQFSNESLAELQLHLNNISNRHMKGIAKWLRVHGGRSIVEPNFANHITKKGMILSDLYNLSKLSFEDGDETVERPVVWANAEDLLSAVADERGIGGQLFVKVMADGGQGFLKICMTVLPENYNPDLDREATEDDDNETMTEPARNKKQQELQQQQMRIQQEEMEAQEKLASKHTNLLKPIYEKIQNKIEQVAKENGYTHVFNANVGGMPVLLYAGEEHNISTLVLKKLGVNPNQDKKK